MNLGGGGAVSGSRCASVLNLKAGISERSTTGRNVARDV